MTTNESVSCSLIGWGMLALILVSGILILWGILRADAQTRTPCPAQHDGLPLVGITTTTGGAVDKCLYSLTHEVSHVQP